MGQPAQGRKRPHSQISSDSLLFAEHNEATTSTLHTSLDRSHLSPPIPTLFRGSFPFLPFPGTSAEQAASEDLYRRSMAPERRRDESSRREESERQVVDLTNDYVLESGLSRSHQPGRLGNARRAPRFANDIIDVENDGDGGQEDSEITFLSSHRLPPRVRRIRTPIPQSSIRSTTNGNSLDEDGFEITGATNLQPTSTLGINNLEGIATLRDSFQGLTHTIHRLMNNFLSPAMDYTQVGFDFSIDRSDTASPPSPPVYQAPSPAPQGFIRSPTEDETYVCPNCDDVLFEGEDDVKRQVWVVRNCGHVYCGECTHNRFITKAKKSRKPNAKTFKQCVVPGCSSRTSGTKAMTQLYI